MDDYKRFLPQRYFFGRIRSYGIPITISIETTATADIDSKVEDFACTTPIELKKRYGDHSPNKQTLAELATSQYERVKRELVLQLTLPCEAAGGKIDISESEWQRGTCLRTETTEVLLPCGANNAS